MKNYKSENGLFFLYPAMINILGEEILKIPNNALFVQDYGKKEAKKARKMGHYLIEDASS